MAVVYQGRAQFQTTGDDIRPNGARLTYRGTIGDESIDINRHMNVSGFDALFDQGEHNLFEITGIWEPWIARRGESLFRLEKVIRYENELLLGQDFEVRSRVIATDGRRIHHFHELWDCAHDRRSAAFDGLSIHVDLTRRKSCPITDPDVLTRLLALEAEAAGFDLPKGVQQRGLSRRAG